MSNPKSSSDINQTQGLISQVDCDKSKKGSKVAIIILIIVLIIIIIFYVLALLGILPKSKEEPKEEPKDETKDGIFNNVSVVKKNGKLVKNKKTLANTSFNEIISKSYPTEDGSITINGKYQFENDLGITNKVNGTPGATTVYLQGSTGSIFGKILKLYNGDNQNNQNIVSTLSLTNEGILEINNTLGVQIKNRLLVDNITSSNGILNLNGGITNRAGPFVNEGDFTNSNGITNNNGNIVNNNGNIINFGNIDNKGDSNFGNNLENNHNFTGIVRINGKPISGDVTTSNIATEWGNIKYSYSIINSDTNEYSEIGNNNVGNLGFLYFYKKQGSNYNTQNPALPIDGDFYTKNIINELSIRFNSDNQSVQINGCSLSTSTYNYSFSQNGEISKNILNNQLNDNSRVGTGYYNSFCVLPKPNLNIPVVNSGFEEFTITLSNNYVNKPLINVNMNYYDSINPTINGISGGYGVSISEVNNNSFKIKVTSNNCFKFNKYSLFYTVIGEVQVDTSSQENILNTSNNTIAQRSLPKINSIQPKMINTNTIIKQNDNSESQISIYKSQLTEILNDSEKIYKPIKKDKSHQKTKEFMKKSNKSENNEKSLKHKKNKSKIESDESDHSDKEFKNAKPKIKEETLNTKSTIKNEKNKKKNLRELLKENNSESSFSGEDDNIQENVISTIHLPDKKTKLSTKNIIKSMEIDDDIYQDLLTKKQVSFTEIDDYEYDISEELEPEVYERRYKYFQDKKSNIKTKEINDINLQEQQLNTKEMLQNYKNKFRSEYKI